MAINREELEKKIAAAKDPAEIVSILHTAGNEITAEEAKQFFEKVQEKKRQDPFPRRDGGSFRRSGLGDRRLRGDCRVGQ